jgi:hypothetical protein
MFRSALKAAPLCHPGVGLLGPLWAIAHYVGCRRRCFLAIGFRPAAFRFVTREWRKLWLMELLASNAFARAREKVEQGYVGEIEHKMFPRRHKWFA